MELHDRSDTQNMNGQENALFRSCVQETSQFPSGARMHFLPMPIANNSVGDIYHRNSSTYTNSTLGSNAELAMNSQSNISPQVSKYSYVVPETRISDICSFDDLMQNPSSLETNIFDNPGDSSVNKIVEWDAIVDCLRRPEHMLVSAREIPASIRTGKKAATEGPNCKCEKSQCLQLYCGCLSSERYCSKHCGCKNCHNNKEHKAEVSDVIARAEISNRHAINADRSTQRSGCNCEKSECIKRYCECYKSQDGCSSQCRCKNCKNLFGRNIESVGISEPMQKVRKLEASIGHRVANAVAFSEQHIPLLPHASTQSLLGENDAKGSSPNSNISILSSQSNITVREERRISPNLRQGEEAVNTGLAYRV